ncbi:MAG: hypothetical protein K5694_00640 [Bacilli bacterium]|nr:hypothetical protein [Bacilli bacterium]
MKKLLLLGATSLMLLASCGGNTNTGGKGLPIIKSESIQKVQTFGQEKGFLINYQYENNLGETFTFDAGMKGETAWFVKDGADGLALKHQDNYHHVFFFDGIEFKYNFSYEKDVFATWFAEGNLLFMAHDINATFTKGEAVALLGRECTYYDFELEVVKDKKYQYKAAIDNELGITLGIECQKLDAPSGEKIKLNATSFKVESEVTAPELPLVREVVIFNEDPELTKIKIPDKIRISLTANIYLNAALEIVGDGLYIDWYWGDEAHRGFYIDKSGTALRYFRIEYDDEEAAWEEFKPSVSGEPTDEKTFSAGLAMLAGSVGSCFVQLFDVSVLDRVSRRGNTVVNGKPAFIYRTNDATYYLATEHHMFLKTEWDENSAWNFEVMDYYEINELSDKPTL